MKKFLIIATVFVLASASTIEAEAGCFGRVGRAAARPARAARAVGRFVLQRTPLLKRVVN